MTEQDLLSSWPDVLADAQARNAEMRRVCELENAPKGLLPRAAAPKNANAGNKPSRRTFEMLLALQDGPKSRAELIEATGFTSKEMAMSAHNQLRSGYIERVGTTDTSPRAAIYALTDLGRERIADLRARYFGEATA